MPCRHVVLDLDCYTYSYLQHAVSRVLSKTQHCIDCIVIVPVLYLVFLGLVLLAY